MPTSSPGADQASPPLEPIVVTPGGPGASIWRDHGWLPIADWQARHDTVLIDPRGVGESGAIDCPGLQDGAPDVMGLRADVTACAASLGAAADRYGTGDAALDIEAVREALGIESFDYYGASYATVAQQAYAARFPERLHALVLDSGFPQADTLDSYYWGVDIPDGWIRIATLECSRSASCKAAHPDPAGEIADLIAKVRTTPIVAKDSLGAKVTVDESSIALILSAIGPGGGVPAGAFLDAAAAAGRGDPATLVQLATDHPIWSTGGGDIADFSQGDNAAAQCVDGAFPWDPTDAPATRADRFRDAVAALPADTFAPFSTAGWTNAWISFLALCFDWPTPTRLEPVIPAGATMPDVPALILSGEYDVNAPIELNTPLRELFPNATHMIVANGLHDAAATFSGPCGGAAVARFFDTLEADPNACSTP